MKFETPNISNSWLLQFDTIATRPSPSIPNTNLLFHFVETHDLTQKRPTASSI
jgi:hypothetical protein